MIQRLGTWLDDRTGYRGVVSSALYEHIPGGSRWRYVWGSTLVFAFAVQVITGLFLWMAYSPSGNTAWESVYYIQYEMQGGWLLRGIHHFMAQAMVVLLGFHLLQVVWDSAYKAPREVNFWLGLVLMQIVLGLSLTGYLLPWDQKGYWATRVATNLMGIVPLVGQDLQQLVVGGADYNHHTVTRFFALHAGWLPVTLVGFLVLHIAVFRRHGINAKLPLRGATQMFWPDQVLKDAVACLAVLLVVCGLAWYFGGAELTAPADGAREYSAARPEWYFLFLFQFLKLFEGMGEMGELIGAIVLPGVAMGVLFLMPLTGRWRIGHLFNVGFTFALLIGALILTVLAYREDSHNVAYRNAVWVAEENAKLAQHLAYDGIPPEGARQLMRHHPQAQALRVITDNCLACHNYVDAKGHGWVLEPGQPAAEGEPVTGGPTAPNLWNFGRSDWAADILNPEKIDSPHYFGNTPLAGGDMAQFVKGDMKDVYKPEDIEAMAAALAAEGGFEEESDLVIKGRELISRDDGCAMCHVFRDAEGAGVGSAPVLTGWGSREWLIGMITNPNHENYYGHAGEQQTMPAFGVVEGDATAQNLSPEVIDYIATWLRGEWYPDRPSTPPVTVRPADDNADAE